MYGVRLLSPWSERWYRADIHSVVDAWIWAVLLLALAAPALSRLVSSEIGARPGTGRGWAALALCFFRDVPVSDGIYSIPVRWRRLTRALRQRSAASGGGHTDAIQPVRWAPASSKLRASISSMTI